MTKTATIDTDPHTLPPGHTTDRLGRLRTFLGAAGVNGLIVPRADEHQGEYVAAHAERLAWLTGFTGSAGTAVVLADRAALFVDGRYTLQAAEEVETSLFTLCPMADITPHDWVGKQANSDTIIGFDPWLMTPSQFKRFDAACRKIGAELRPLDRNPIDAIWEDQPPPPLELAESHDIRYSGESAARRLKKIATILKDTFADAVFISAPDSIAWLLNIRGNDVPYTPICLAHAIVYQNCSVDLFADGRKFSPIVRAHLGSDVRICEPGELTKTLNRLGADGKKVLVSETLTPVFVITQLEAAGAGIVFAEDPCQKPKACKTEAEIAGMRAAHIRDGAALCRFLAWLDREAPSGRISEQSAADRLDAFRQDNDLFRGLSFPTISGAGPNGAIVHYRVSETSNLILEAGTLYLVDSGAQYLDGTTDVTRTVAIGTPSDEMRDRFTRVLKGHIRLASALFPKGTTGGQLDVLARTALWQAGLDYEHGTGHGVGSYLGVHEGPQRISKAGSVVALEPGMVVSNEPGYYKAGAYGIRIENLIVVAPVSQPDAGEREMFGFETLTLAPIDQRLIKTGLLDGDERSWLDHYHARVRATLQPVLDADTARWLEDATRPLA